jgi:hypothetical protein
MKKRTMLAAMLTLALGAGATTVIAADQAQRPQRTADEIKKAKPSGTIEFEAEQIRLIVGGGSGKGVLTYQGKTYPFTFKGASVGGVGVTKVHGVGNVYFLDRLEDFPGTYTAVGAGATAVKGVGASDFENGKGVFISVRAKTEGVGLSLGLTGAVVEFVK